ncbi:MULTISPECIES: hypothetical protein [unclassified Halomonas]|uniref:hypothetical protein n=1 Tax=unclassified Halomonas TaxID=2609666 RepID=UPI001EF699A3|nr:MULTISPECIES: hypothetical protein [unclassified Halomonas]MCG7590717.1 hypothetical protein [Halomonas sp. McD50-5]MCG7616829.1 hypothetical protein [Halomonas sp. McD50-4]
MSNDELFIFKDAAKLAGINENALLKRLVDNNTPLLYKPNSFIHLYCLSVDMSLIAPFSPFQGFLDDNRTVYKEFNDFDYIVIDSIAYDKILCTKSITITFFYSLARFNHLKNINILSAKDVALNETDKKLKASNVSKRLRTDACFCFFESKNSSQNLKVKKTAITLPPINPCELFITKEQLWVRRHDLNKIIPHFLQQQINKENKERLRNKKIQDEAKAIQDEIIQLENLDVAEEWMNDNLIMLNRACIRLLIAKKINTINDNEQMKILIKEFISDSYREINKKEISLTVLSACTDVVITEQLMKNMHAPSLSEKSRYHAAITPAVVNMNEFTRKISERIDRNNPPRVQDIKDQADNEKALPKRISQQLARFMLPKY